jgi:hypothetical protein
MAVQHVNRKGDTYYLHTGSTRTGKPRYWFSRQSGDCTVEALPAGYEIFEHPEDGQVFLRRTKPSRITLAERELVVDSIKRGTGLHHYRVDVEGNSLVIYTPVLEEDEADSLVNELGVMSFRKASAKERLLQGSDFCKVMRFTVTDPEARLFSVERSCFKGSIDNWIALDRGKPLAELVGRLVRHVGKQSFFDLM